MVHSTAYGHPIHRDCRNYVNRICRLNGSPVDPNGPACPRFTPKSTIKTVWAEASYPRVRRPYQMYLFRRQGQPFGGQGVREMSMGESMDRTRDIMAYPLNPPMNTKRSTIVRAQEEEMLKQQLIELERQLIEVKRKLKLRARHRKSFLRKHSDC